MENLSFGQKLVGLTFNPSGYEKVNRAKQLCAELADIAESFYEENYGNKETSEGFLVSEIYKHSIGEILNAQMNVVKLLTLKY